MTAPEAEGSLTNVFEQELQSAFNGLRSIDESLRSLNGRLPPDASRGRFSRGGGRGGGPGRFGPITGPGLLFQIAKTDETADPRIAAVKRRFSAAVDAAGEEETFYSKRGRVSGESFRNGDHPHKPVIASAVMAAQRDLKSREAAIDELKQTEKKEVKQRNRRMFGMLVGTLQKFKQDEDKFKDHEKKQREFEKKLEIASQHEQEEAKKQKQQLLQKRREQQNEIRRIQRKMMYIEMASEWETYMEKLQNFIQTQTKPPIFYLPAKHTMRTIELHKKSAKRVQELINQHKEKLQRDLEAIENQYANKSEQVTEPGDPKDAPTRSGPNKRAENSGSSEESESEPEDQELPPATTKNGDLTIPSATDKETSPNSFKNDDFVVIKVEN